jgi:hypothetical protein
MMGGMVQFRVRVFHMSGRQNAVKSEGTVNDGKSECCTMTGR